MNERLRVVARRILAAALVGAAAFFLARVIVRHWGTVAAFPWRLDPWLLVASVAAHAGVLAWGVWVWGRVVAQFEHDEPDFRTLLRIWSASNAARYIPGTVWQFVATAEMARSRGLSRVVLLASQIVHVGFSLLAAVLLALLTLPTARAFPLAVPAPLAGLFAVGSVALVHPHVINAALGAAARVTRREVRPWRGAWADGIVLLGLQFVGWVLYGAAFWLFLRSIAPVPPRLLLPAAGVNAASFVAGWIVLIAPAGAGARETAMTELLRAFVPFGVAAALSVLSRLWSIAAELVTVAIAFALRAPAPPR